MWLHELTTDLFGREWAGAGGRTLPEQAFSPPPWLLIVDPTLATLACFDRGSRSFRLTETPYGNNMAFRKELFSKYGYFRTELGPQPGNLIRSEDAEFGRRLLSAGERLKYVPGAVVFHAVAQSRIQKSYFLSWWFDKARADVRAANSKLGSRFSMAAILLVLFGRLVVWTLRWMLATDPAKRFSSKISVWIVAGQILENAKLRRTRRGEDAEIVDHEVVSSASVGPNRN
jgi:GT2 family glycosyltransferase